MQEKQDVELAVQRACVEIFALKQEGQEIDSAYEAKAAFDAEGWTRVCTKTKFEQLDGGEVVLKYADEEIQTQIMDAIMNENQEKKEVEAEQEAEGIEEGEELAESVEAEEGFQQQEKEILARDGQEPIQDQPSKIRESENQESNVASTLQEDHQAEAGITGTIDQSWRTVPLTNPELKFAILKRTTQLLGLRIPDPQIISIKDAASLLDVLLIKSKPKKLSEELFEGGRLDGLKNLQVFERRYSNSQRDEELGRMKVIEREFLRRGLPVSMR